MNATVRSWLLAALVVLMALALYTVWRRALPVPPTVDVATLTRIDFDGGSDGSGQGNFMFTFGGSLPTSVLTAKGAVLKSFVVAPTSPTTAADAAPLLAALTTVSTTEVTPSMFTLSVLSAQPAILASNTLPSGVAGAGMLPATLMGQGVLTFFV